MRRVKDREQHYVVVNQDGKVFSGILGGQFQYSNDWSKAKPLPLSNTMMLMTEPKNELIKEEELV